MGKLVVECREDPRDPSGHRIPARFGYRSGRGAHLHEVVEVVDRWPGEDLQYFRVRAADGGTYILRHAGLSDRWELVFFRADETAEAAAKSAAKAARKGYGAADRT